MKRLNKWKNISYSYIRRINAIQTIIQIQYIPTKIPAGSAIDMEKLISNNENDSCENVKDLE